MGSVCIPGSRNIPADLYVPRAGPDARPVAVDVAVVTPVPSWKPKPGHTLRDMESLKVGKYANDLATVPHLVFIPFVMSCYGSLGQKAREFVSIVAAGLTQKWLWSVMEAEEYVRRVIQAAVMAFLGDQMLKTLKPNMPAIRRRFHARTRSA